MVDEKPRFENPWKDEKDFVFLGYHDTYYPKEHRTEKYDLYALVRDNGYISFGARYSDKDSEYISAGAILSSNDVWQFSGVRGPTAVAAALYFANHHHKDVVNEKTNSSRL